MKKIVLRMDDVGASTKVYNQHGKVYWKLFGKNIPLTFFANWLFLKRVPPFKRWGVYNEISPKQWQEIFIILRSNNAKLTVAVTACWVVSEYEIIPFDEIYPDQAAVLREGIEEGLIEVANHGLTHCVVKDNLFRPRLFSSNRIYHREFWDWLPDSYHKEHIDRSQEILTRIFKKEIVTFVPPGNIWTEVTEQAAGKAGIKYLSSKEKIAPTGKERNGLKYVGSSVVVDFHDREIDIMGPIFVDETIKKTKGKYCTIREYFEK